MKNSYTFDTSKQPLKSKKMKTLTSKTINKVIADAKKMTYSPIERRMISELLFRGTTRTAEQKGFSTDDRTSRILDICSKLNLNVDAKNDAPKGGEIGNFIEGRDGDEFFDKIKTMFSRLRSIKKCRQERIRIEEHQKRCSQKKQLLDYCNENESFVQKIKNRIENESSKDWRNWVRMKSCQAINNENFGTFELSAVDVSEIIYQSNF